MSERKNPNKPVIVALDGHTLNPGDLSWAGFESLGSFSVYPRSAASEVIQRASLADILLVNKVVLNREILLQLPRLKCICVTATGFNNIDLEAATAQGIVVCNATGYGSPSVAQHVFALLLECTNQVARHHQSVLTGIWSGQPDFSHPIAPLTELRGKAMGVFGFGRIGREVAGIALAFGMNVYATHRRPLPNAPKEVIFTDIRDLFVHCDVISLHAPLTPDTRGIINGTLLHTMKESAILINTGRGELIVEEDLFDALKQGRPGMAALDVLAVEPPPRQHPLFSLPNCIITPHIAWATREARSRLLEITLTNVRAFLNSAPQNQVNPKR
jgi:glycerate dehydrogenase